MPRSFKRFFAYRPKRQGWVFALVLVAEIAIMSVPAAERMMATARALRSQGTLPDLLFFLAHPETVSVGLKGRMSGHLEDLLVPETRLQEEGIALTRSIRGGGITYHWPGQVVCYPVMELQGQQRNIPEFMNRLEQVGINSLASFGIEAVRCRDTPSHIGLWHGNRKIVSMGIRISGWITSFGFAINHSGDYSRAAYVRPCGIEGLRLITMEDVLPATPPRCQVIHAVKEHFASVFGRDCKSPPPEVLNRLGL